MLIRWPNRSRPNWTPPSLPTAAVAAAVQLRLPSSHCPPKTSASRPSQEEGGQGVEKRTTFNQTKEKNNNNKRNIVRLVACLISIHKDVELRQTNRRRAGTFTKRARIIAGRKKKDGH